MENKGLSVIIPVYNAQKTIVRCLASLVSNMDYIGEVIVVDDHSNDLTIRYVELFQKIYPKIKIITSSGLRNPGVARKTGLLEAQGEWVTFLDADDCLTPSSLHYAIKRLDRDCVLLHTKSIYYESGIFKTESIDYSDLSCGGNFYRREYLIDNNLLPHDRLRLSEDEYFNNIVIDYIHFLDNPDYEQWWDYPVYEVHHDIDDGRSYSIRHWSEYLIRSHLKSSQYVADFFGECEGELWDHLREEFIKDFIFCYFLLQGVAMDSDVVLDYDAEMEHFKDAYEYLCDHFGGTKHDLLDYYNSQSDIVENLWDGAQISTGIEFDEYLVFESFIEGIV